MDKKVSVIVPVYNSEKYLPMCLDSIINQTYKNLEIILIDDGSTDKSLEICTEYASIDKRIRVFHQENEGVSSARNFGIEVANGEYITFVDSDDELLENGISLLVSDIISYDADITSASTVYVNPNKTDIDGRIKSNFDVSVFCGIEALQLSLDFDRRMTACHGKLFSKQFIGDIRYEKGRKINEDFYFIFLCCMKQPRFVYRNECVYKYYHRDISATHTPFGDKYLDMIYFSDQKKKAIESCYPELRDKAICMEVSTHLFLLNALCKTNDKKYKNYEKNSIRIVCKNYKKYITNNKFEKRLAWIVSHGLYSLYKMAIRLKYYK